MMERTIDPARVCSRQVIKEYREHQNPPVSADIDVVWVISGWNVYNPRLSPDFVNVSRGTIFENEDTRMINMGIELAYEITTKRLNKNRSEVNIDDIRGHGPILLYNGNIDQNENLQLASQKEGFPFPTEKLRIEKLADDRDPKNNNTNKQFEKFPQDLLKVMKKMAVVSYLWHIPRIARNPLAPSLLQKERSWENIRFVYFAADIPGTQLAHDQKSVHKRAIDIRKHIMNEGRKIHNYAQKGDLTLSP